MKILKTTAVSFLLSMVSYIVATIIYELFADIYIIHPIICVISYFILRYFIKAEDFFYNLICIVEIFALDILLLIIPKIIVNDGTALFFAGLYIIYIKYVHIMFAVIVVINIIWAKRKVIKEHIFSFFSNTV